MGMFSDYRSISKTSKEMRRNTDVKASFAGMQSKMEALNSTLSATATGRAATEGSLSTATVTAATPTGTLVNFAPTYQLDLMVMVPGRPPMAVSRTEIIPPLYLSRAMPGQRVAVRVVLDDPTDLVIDWDGPV